MDIHDVIKALCGSNGFNKIPVDILQSSSLKAGQEIMVLWTHLNEILIRHEAVIRERWKKKTITKRRDFLLNIRPSMAENHRPDDWRIADGAVERAAKPSDIWPYINLEDLTNNKSLLVFLNARGRNLPHTFAPAEMQFSNPLTQPKEIDFHYSGLKMFLGEQLEIQHDVTRMYGRIAESTAAKSSASDGVLYAPVSGIYILALQREILNFLLLCCVDVLHDIPTTLLSSTCYAIRADPPALLTHGDLESNFTDSARLAPYRSRSTPDFPRIRYLISTVLNSVKDHAWQLREDPGYFAEHIQALADHHDANILCDAGLPYPGIGSRAFFKAILAHDLHKLYMDLMVWDKIYEIFNQLDALAKDLADSNLEVLPKLYSDTLEALYAYLVQQRKSGVSYLNRITAGSPTLRHLWKRFDFPGKSEYTIKPKTGEDPVGSDVVLALRCIESEHRSAQDLHFRLDYLEISRSRTPSFGEKISPLMDRQLAPLSICVECIHQLKVAASHASAMSSLEKLDEDPFTKQEVEFGPARLMWNRLDRKTMVVGHLVAPNLGDPTDGKFNYPDEDATSQTVVETRRKAERNLDRYWTYVDNALRKATGHAQHDTIRRIYDEGGSMRRTAPWSGLSGRKKPARSVDHYEYHPLSEVFHDATKQVTGNFDRMSISSKVKEKTRGSPAEMLNCDVEEAHESEPTIEKPIFHVGKASYTVFRTLFYSQSDGELPRNIRWGEVVSALTKLGFSAEKLHGSAWQFTSTKLGLNRGIQFHEPHPDDEVPLALARRYGRRLNRAYGWDGSMFKRK